MKIKLIATAIVATIALASPFASVNKAEAASLVDYALLTKLISTIAYNASNLPNSYQLSDLQVCADAADRCNRASNEAQSVRIASYSTRGSAQKCFYDLYKSLGRSPTTDELNTTCGSKINIYTQTAAQITHFTTAQTKACEIKNTACVGFEAVFQTQP